MTLIDRGPATTTPEAESGMSTDAGVTRSFAFRVRSSGEAQVLLAAAEPRREAGGRGDVPAAERGRGHHGPQLRDGFARRRREVAHARGNRVEAADHGAEQRAVAAPLELLHGAAHGR